ncbi:MAG: capsular polysaccharide biosynthesis ywqC [Candidatus Saccharibacteria bacterium]|nr:capsular polysaccharide biosynthesis ywqC [Candidatus Saccharibacteria bacterium]
MQEINLYKLLAFYAKNWILILSLTLAGLLGGFVYNQYVQVPMYKSEATMLYINPDAVNYTQDTSINSYVELFSSRRVIEPVLSKQKLGLTYEELRSSVDAVNEKGTGVIELSVSTDNAKKSQTFLRAAVESFRKQAEALYGADKLQVIDDASSAEPPYNVRKGFQLVVATSIAFLLSLIILFFIFDAKGGKIEPKVKKPKVKKLRVVKQAVVKPSKTKNGNVKRNSVILRGIKEYFTVPKEDLMINPPEPKQRQDKSIEFKNTNVN